LVVVHESRLVAPAIRAHLDGRIEVLAETVFGAAVVAMAELLSPDLIVASEVFADGLVDQFLPLLLRCGSRVLVLVERGGAERVLDLLEAGASGVCCLDQGLDEVCRSVEEVARGGVAIPGEALGSLVGEWRLARRTGEMRQLSGSLTPREIEVLSAMADGLTTKAIARLLGVALKTVENHKTRVFHKLGVRTQAQAVAVAVSGGLGAKTIP